MQEKWVSIESSPGYEVSSIGRVRSLDAFLYKKGRKGKVCKWFRRGRILKFSPNCVNNSGYISGMLGKNKSIMVHRLVAEAFCPRTGTCKVVNHKNGIKTDNRAENLEWVTYRQNTIHGRISNRAIGKSFTIDTVIEIIKSAHLGIRVLDLSKKYSVSRQCISRILSGRMWPSADYPEICEARKKYPYTSPKHGTKWNIG